MEQNSAFYLVWLPVVVTNKLAPCCLATRGGDSFYLTQICVSTCYLR